MMDVVPTQERGHRVVPHTADLILEAWGPDLASCCEEAVAALVVTFADAAGAEVAGRREVHLPPAEDESLLLDVLDEVIFTLDTEVTVPIGACVTAAADGGVDLVLPLADRDDVRATGAVPKAISRSELGVATVPEGVRCRFLVDV